MILRALIITGVTVGGLVYLGRGDVPEMQREVCKIGYVYDGDTVEMICDERSYAARLVGLDTPETKDPRCDAERAAGKRATERLRALVATGAVAYDRKGVDRYKRPLIVLRVDGVDVAETLVSEGLAVAYRGGARPDWCARLKEARGQPLALPGVFSVQRKWEDRDLERASG